MILGKSWAFIYNRYGKFLAQLTADSSGWNGTFLGKRIPSSEYWFKIDLGNGKIFSGHFALKR